MKHTTSNKLIAVSALIGALAVAAAAAGEPHGRAERRPPQRMRFAQPS